VKFDFIAFDSLESTPQPRIVEALDVVEDIRWCVGTSKVTTTIDAFSFQTAEEALDQSIVCAATYSAHATNQVMAIQELLMLVAGELASPVGMQNYRGTIRQCPCRDGNSQQVLQGRLTIRDFLCNAFHERYLRLD
jgi:hypothetical protein